MSEFIDKYGDDQYDQLIAMQEVILHQGKVVVLR